MTRQPSCRSSSGDVGIDAPFPQSSTTVNFRSRIFGPSTHARIPSTYEWAPCESAVIVPMPPYGADATTPAATPASIASSVVRDTSSPSAAMHLRPLNSGGLCDAVTITPSWAPSRRTLHWIAGVGRSPTSTTRCPASASTEPTIRENATLEVRPSHPTTMGAPGAKFAAIASATDVTKGAVSFSPTTSRIPFVPKRRAGVAMAISPPIRRYIGRGDVLPGARGRVAPPRWLADEMLGRLARYLRFSGCDTLYARNLSDDQIVEIATDEDRVVLTRDRALAQRSEGSLLLASATLKDQWLAVARAFPELPHDVAFSRCTLCNGVLRPWQAGIPTTPEEAVPRARAASGVAVFQCAACAHLYWEGTHTQRVRDTLRAWTREIAP
jgi:uncharacterized protein